MKSRWIVLMVTIAGVLAFSACGGVNMSNTQVHTTYTIGGTISGLAGTGLVLQDNLTNNLTVTGNGSFTFSAAITSGGPYSVTVQTQPTNPAQTCSVANGSGTALGNVITVAVTCITNTVPTYTIGGTVSGLIGTVVLQDNLTDNLSLSATGGFTFATQIPSGGAYSVTVLTQPTGQTCSVASGSGTATGNVTNVAVTCSAITYSIGGTVSGLTGTVVLQDNLTDNLSLSANGGFTFATKIPSGGAYSVTVLTQPTGQTCSVTSGSGTATGNVTNVVVTCSAITYSIGGTVSGLTGTVVLQDNLTDNLSLSANGGFTFATKVPSGGAYSVTVLTQPTGQTCSVTNGSGTATGNVTNVAVTCSAVTYSIGGTVSGLTGTVVLQDNLTDNLSLNTNGGFTFATKIPSGGAYSVTVLTQPAGQSCSVTNGSGTATGNVTNVAVNCVTTPTYTIGGTVSGLTGTVVLQDNLTDNLSLSANGGFTFATQIPSGGAYSVTVLTQPAGQTCSVTNGSGTATGNVTNVAVNCVTTPTYSIGGTVSGLTGTVVLQDNLTDNLSLSANGGFTFATKIPSGGAYSVTVLTQPTGQTCTVANGSGTATGNVTNVAVTCSASSSSNTWTWQNGANVTGQKGSYGTKKSFNSTNVPGARYGAVTWTDGSGNLWLFGGIAIDSTTNSGYMNDLWEWKGGQWGWMSGSNVIDANGVYGTLGVAAGTNIPGARYGAASWKDTTGNLWLFGGFGLDSNILATAGQLNDLWEFNMSTAQWIWQGPLGSDTINQPGKYAKTGTGNFPGGRYSPSAYADASGNFWLFGGLGFASTGGGITGSLNDLWEFSPSTLQWTWISGASTLDQSPHYGTQGSTGPLNIPGARYGSVSWIDSSGNFWLFGGLGIDKTSAKGLLSDVWEYFPSVGQWAWEGPTGSDTRNQAGNYVGLGLAGTPGGRMWPSGWLDSSQNFWLFGGQEIGGEGLNDLWEYTAGNWTWVNGSSSPNQLGTYPSAFGSTGTPGSRYQSASWVDIDGQNLWLFGGYGAATAYPVGALNDLWEYQP